MLNVTSGVPQGSILGTYLFNVFVLVSNLTTACDRAQIVKFADDTTILIPVLRDSIEDDCVLIGNEINNVLHWATKILWPLISINVNCCISATAANLQIFVFFRMNISEYLAANR